MFCKAWSGLIRASVNRNILSMENTFSSQFLLTACSGAALAPMDREKVNNYSHKRAPFLVVGFFVLYVITAVLSDWCKHRTSDWKNDGVHFSLHQRKVQTRSLPLAPISCTLKLCSRGELADIAWSVLISFNTIEHFHPLFIPKSLWL